MIRLDDATLLSFLHEDAPYGDLTTRSLEIGKSPARMTFSARGAMTVCAPEDAARLVELAGAHATSLCRTGDDLLPGDVILQAEGRAEDLLLAWKVTQMMVEWSSGIATSAAEIVQAARKANPAINVSCTRKSAPGTRLLSTMAILAGGAEVHRTGLSDTVLLFPDHRNLATPGADALKEQISSLKQRCPERRIVVEVKNIPEALKAADYGAEVLQLEKFAPEDVRTLAEQIEGSPVVIAAAGGINAQNAEVYAASGADILVTSSPYYAKPADVQVRFSRQEEA